MNKLNNVSPFFFATIIVATACGGGQYPSDDQSAPADTNFGNSTQNVGPTSNGQNMVDAQDTAAEPEPESDDDNVEVSTDNDTTEEEIDFGGDANTSVVMDETDENDESNEVEVNSDESDESEPEANNTQEEVEETEPTGTCNFGRIIDPINGGCMDAPVEEVEETEEVAETEEVVDEPDARDVCALAGAVDSFGCPEGKERRCADSLRWTQCRTVAVESEPEAVAEEVTEPETPAAEPEAPAAEEVDTIAECTDTCITVAQSQQDCGEGYTDAGLATMCQYFCTEKAPTEAEVTCLSGLTCEELLNTKGAICFMSRDAEVTEPEAPAAEPEPTDEVECEFDSDCGNEGAICENSVCETVEVVPPAEEPEPTPEPEATEEEPAPPAQEPEPVVEEPEAPAEEEVAYVTYSFEVLVDAASGKIDLDRGGEFVGCVSSEVEDPTNGSAVPGFICEVLVDTTTLLEGQFTATMSNGDQKWASGWEGTEDNCRKMIRMYVYDEDNNPVADYDNLSSTDFPQQMTSDPINGTCHFFLAAK